MSWNIRKETVVVEELSVKVIKENFMVFGSFKHIRSAQGLKVQTCCKVCDKVFEEKQEIHLCITNNQVPNFLICDDCLEEARKHIEI